MRNLRASESIHDNLARDAAITEMGRRLAAQGVRARRRQSSRLAAPPDLHDIPVAPAVVAPGAVEREDILASPWPVPDLAPEPAPGLTRTAIPWARYVATLRRVTLLGATAACGFTVVLYAENLRVTAFRHHDGPVAEAAPKMPASPVEVAALPAPPPPEAQPAPVPVIEEAIAAETLPVPPGEQIVATLNALPARSVVVKMPAADVLADPGRPVRGLVRTPIPLAAPVISAPTIFASATQPARRATPPASGLLARAAPKPRLTPHVTLAKFEFPRWLIDRRTQPPAPRIMSEPAHDLALPQVASSAPAPVPSAPVEPVSAAPAPVSAPAPEQEPAPRPRPPRATYAYGSPYPYGNPYSGYGAPYGYPYPYPLPPLRRPAFYTAQAPSPQEYPQQGSDQPYPNPP